MVEFKVQVPTRLIEIDGRVVAEAAPVDHFKAEPVIVTAGFDIQVRPELWAIQGAKVIRLSKCIVLFSPITLRWFGCLNLNLVTGVDCPVVTEGSDEILTGSQSIQADTFKVRDTCG